MLAHQNGGHMKAQRALFGVAIALAAPAIISGCGGGASSTAGDPETSASSAVASVEVPTVGMLDACPQVESMLPKATVPGAIALSALEDQLVTLRASADLETQNALDFMIQGVDDAVTAYTDPDAVMPAVDAMQAYLGGISTFAKRCRTAGSSALQ
jgi:hypothetical protein